MPALGFIRVRSLNRLAEVEYIRLRPGEGAGRAQPNRQPYDIAAFTRSGENGTRRSRTPVASKIALAIAAATGRLDGSPAPEGGISEWSISTTSIFSGVSLMSRIG